jgi:hypothetical protein
MPADAFAFRPRRGDKPWTLAPIGATIALDERDEYLIRFEKPLSPANRQRLFDLNGELLDSDLATLSFGNFVGRTELAGVAIEVVSTKLGRAGVSAVLEEVSALAASLIFGVGSPTTFEGIADPTALAPVPYHQLQFLRQMMLQRAAGQRLQDWLGIVERNPTRRFEPERPVVSPERVRRLDHRAVRSIFSRLERLVPVPTGATIAANQLAQKLTFGDPPRAHFPSRVAAPRGRLSFDTPENRFVRHVVGDCLGLVYRFADHPKLHDGLKADCRSMLVLLEKATSAPFLADVARLVGFQAPSQALAKSDGYREIFGFWRDLTHHISLPLSASETTRLLEGRDMAALYEYWVFVKILEAAIDILGAKPASRPLLRRDQLGESLRLGCSTTLGPELTIEFNPTFRRSNATAYSTPLRPDVTLRVGDAIHAFDAKYRLDRFDAGELDPGDDTATYKQADLYKMHTYRDAITGLKTAFVVYPGTEFVFFERNGSRRLRPQDLQQHDGVGAAPARPADANPAATLRELLGILLMPQAPTGV